MDYTADKRRTRDRIERIMHRRRVPVIRKQLEDQRQTEPWTEAELREAWGR